MTKKQQINQSNSDKYQAFQFLETAVIFQLRVNKIKNMHQEKTLSITKGFVWYFNSSNLGRLAAVSETENSGKELIENFDYKIGDYVEHRKMWSNIAWGWITVEVYKNKQLIYQFDFDNEVKKAIAKTQKINDYADNQVKEFRRKHYGE